MAENVTGDEAVEYLRARMPGVLVSLSPEGELRLWTQVSGVVACREWVPGEYARASLEHAVESMRRTAMGRVGLNEPC